MANEVTDNAARQRYEMQVEGSVAFIDYRDAGTVRILTHAEVPVALRGRGIAGQMTAGVLELVRARNGTVVPRCPYIANYIASHPQYQDLVARA